MDLSYQHIVLVVCFYKQNCANLGCTLRDDRDYLIFVYTGNSDFKNSSRIYKN